MHKGSGYQNGHREPMEPEDEYQRNGFNYFEQDQYAQEQNGHYHEEHQYYQEEQAYSQEEQDGAYYQGNEQHGQYEPRQQQQQQAVYSPRLMEDGEEPPSLSPRFDAPEGIEDSTPYMKHKDSLVREQLGYPLGEDLDEHESVIGGDDAALDLAELEQLQEEAERMKGLGNKHMAAQVSFG